MSDAYTDFLAAKVKIAEPLGFATPVSAYHRRLQEKAHQALMAQWMVAGGRRALFASFGLGKTGVQLDACRVTLSMCGKVGAMALIVLPLGVRQEFMGDAAAMGIDLKFIRTNCELVGPGLYCTNYETVRDGKLDVSAFAVASLDEASVLRGFGGSKTFREFMRLFEGVPYRFVATATPAPNEYIELLAYAAYLGVMDVGEAKTRFFKRNSEKADALTLHPHKEQEFWLWVASWALFIDRPSDIGCSDEGYELPELVTHWHEIAVDHGEAGTEKGGQMKMFRDTTGGIVEAAAEKRRTLAARVAKMGAILAADPDGHYVLWHHLEDERAAIEDAVPGVVSAYGAQDLDDRERSIRGFSQGFYQYLSTKPVIAGSGCNFQHHCHKAIFVGVDFKFNDFIQAVHRIQRFLQPHACEQHIIYAESERHVVEVLKRKWRDHDAMVEKMRAIIREHGLTGVAMGSVLQRSMGVERVEASGEGYRCVLNDTVLETAAMAAGSVDLIVTSIPFSTQYEYTPSFNDFGHTDDNAHFWAQMDFLTANLLRVLRPGRVAAIHVKDRITPGGINGFGFQTVEPFSDECVAHFRRHGFAFLARKTITTDVVRENNQTYRLGWSEQLKDGTRMGAGMPEYLLIFRAPQSDRSKGYADQPVEKARPDFVDLDGAATDYSTAKRDIRPVAGTGYSRGRWQLDAHGYMRSSGDRLLAPEELLGLDAQQIYRTWRAFNLDAVYDFELHVRIAEALDARAKLPPTFMLLPPHSGHPDVWTDVARMRTLNGEQQQRQLMMHLCPLQFDIVDRAINQYSMPGETVFDPFGGLMTVPVRAMRLGRVGVGVELNPGYWADGARICEAQARKMAVPSLMDWLAPEDADDEAVGDPADEVAA